jgi:hypothetical protein
MLQETPEVIQKDVRGLLSSAGTFDKVGVCCINMDYGTPDENVTAILEALESYR